MITEEVLQNIGMVECSLDAYRRYFVDVSAQVGLQSDELPPIGDLVVQHRVTGERVLVGRVIRGANFFLNPHDRQYFLPGGPC